MEQPHVVVLFGATGDLARRKLLPGLLHLLEAGLLDEGGLRLRSLVLPDRWLEQGTPAGQYAEAGLDAKAIAAAAVRALGRPGRLGLAQGAA